jgi:hypothetical protein
MEKENAIAQAKEDIELLYQGIALINMLPSMPVTSYFIHPGTITINADHYDDWNEITEILLDEGWRSHDSYLDSYKVCEMFSNGSPITLAVSIHKDKVAISYGSR